MSSKSRRSSGISLAAKANLRWFLLSGVFVAILIAGALVIKQRVASPPASPVEATADPVMPTPSAPRASEATPPADKAAALAVKSQKRRLIRLMSSHKLTMPRRVIQATAHRPIEATKALAKAATTETAPSKEVKEAGAVALGKAMLEAATPRPLFSVAGEPDARKPIQEVAVAAASAKAAQGAGELLTKRQRLTAALSTARKAAARNKAVAGNEDSEEESEVQVQIDTARANIAPEVSQFVSAPPGEFNGDVRDLPQGMTDDQRKMFVARPELDEGMVPKNKQVLPGAPSAQPAQPEAPLAPMPAPLTSFKGLQRIPNGAGFPPDTVGDVGTTYFIQAVNTSVGIYNKTTGAAISTFTFNTLFTGAGTGTPCDNAHQGDPTVIYDHLADRWFVADFAWASGALQNGPYYECIAVSKTNDPVTGGWWLYGIRADDAAHPWLPDYPKMGLWPDGLYMSGNMFDCLNASCSSATYKGARAFAFNRTNLISGTAVQTVIADVGTSEFTLLPSNLRGTAPPAGRENFFVSESSSAFGWNVYKFHAVFGAAGSTFTGPTVIPQTSYPGTNPTVTTPGGTLDNLLDRMMMQVQYRNISGVESLWVNHTVPTSSNSAILGIQWAQLNITGGVISPVSVQQQLYGNLSGDLLHRWMGSLAVDKDGNMALGYSAANATTDPDIRYAGRLATDALNSLPQTETSLLGAATRSSQNNTVTRWGDYSAMTVDPDGCTFWFTTEYYETLGNNWQTRIGSFKFPTCNPPTAVKVKAFTADGFDDGQVLLQWNTSYEVDNLGYNVYREVGGLRTRVNAQLIAGSALITGHAVALSSGRSYAWSDLPATGSAARYWLEDIDVNGKSSFTGPVAVAVKKGKAPTTDQAQLLTQLGQSQGLLANGQGSAPVERRAQVARVTAAGLQAQADLAGGSAFKVGVSAEGWYRIPQRDLVAAGLDAKSDPRLLQLFVDGQQVPIIVNGEADGRFDDTDSVEFYGVGLNSLFTSDHTYWLAVGQAGGQRIKAVQATGGVPAPAGFQTAVERKDRTIYFSALRNGDAENFFGPVVNTTGVTQTLDVKNVMPAASGVTLDVSVQGVNLGAHQVKVLVNGSAVGTMAFDGQRLASQTFSLPASLVKEGTNSVQLTALGGSTDISLVDTLRINYAHKYAADNNQLRFTAQGGQQVALSGFTSANVRVMDVTDPNSPQEVRVAPGGKAGSGLTLSVPGTGPRTLYAFAVEQAKSAAPRKDAPSTWRQAGRSADYVVITRGDLLASATTLANYRRDQGYKVAVVDVEDLFDEFNYGNRSPQAVRDFLAFAKANWAVAPRFVVLAGDGTFDYKNNLGLGNTDVVPAKLVDTSYMETVSDDWYVDFDEDGVPDMAIGRLPVRNATEASRVVAKIIGYDSQPSANSVLFVSDTNDSYDFAGSNAALRPLIPPTLKVAEIQRGSSDDATVRAQLLASLAGGHKVVSYSGHGSVNSWRGNLLTSDDAGTLTNGKSLELFVVMNCLNGYYIDPAFSSIGEELLRAQQGGAVAVWASSGQTEGVEQAALSQEFYRQLFGQTPLTVGEAAARAKSAVSNPDIRRTWTLLGDPALRLK